MLSSIHLRITTLITVLITVTELAVGLLGMYRTANSYHTGFDDNIREVFTEELRKELTDAASAIYPSSEPNSETGVVMSDSGPDNVKDISDILLRYAEKLGIDPTTFLYVLDSDGAVVYSSSSNDTVEPTEVTSAALAGEESINNSIFHSYIDYALPLKSGDTVQYVVYIKDTLVVKQAIIPKLVSNLIMTILISAAAAFIASWLLSRSVTAPIKTLASQAKRLADGDIASISRTDRTDEIGELADAMLYLSESRREHSDRATAEMTKLEKILSNMNDGILAFDMRGRLTHINPEAQRLINRNYIDDITFNEFFKEINADITLESLQYTPTDDAVEREIQLNNQILQLNFALFSRESSEGGVIVIIHDITRHERLESARRDFVANVSHELRTPLTVIKSYADILADTPDAESEVRTRFLDTISSETDRMTKIISDLLTLSKLDENANYERPSEDIDIRTMLNGLIERLSLTAKKKEQTLNYTPINDVPVIRGDRDGLERVFTNIISNALKYTPSGGEINVFSSKLYNDILIKISDNGIGISKENLPNIFDRFYRVDKARSRDKGGTGLGLAIAKETIENGFGGKILITSELNKGTDVTISIPVPKK